MEDRVELNNEKLLENTGRGDKTRLLKGGQEQEGECDEEKAKLAVLLQRKVLKKIEDFIDQVSFEEFKYSCENIFDKQSFSDLAEERSLGGSCGYGLCGNPLPKNQKFQKFRIHQNVVYDMSSRSYFCSDSCFNQFLHVRQQLREDALWITGERPAGKIDFLSVDDTKTQYLGIKVEFPESLVESMRELSVKENSAVATKASKLSNASRSADPLASQKTASGSCQPVVEISGRCETETNQKDKVDDIVKNIRKKYFDCQSSNLKTKVIPRKFLVPLVEAKPMKPVTDSDNVGNTENSEDVPNTLHEEQRKTVEKLLAEWITEETKKIFNIIPENPEENASCGSTEVPNRHQEEVMGYKAKVEEFFKGELQQGVTKESEKRITMPPIDNQNQMLLRRNIVLERIKKSWTTTRILFSLELCIDDIGEILRDLICTFNLTAENIVAKPKEWKLISLVVLFMIGEKDETVKKTLVISKMKLREYIGKNSGSDEEYWPRSLLHKLLGSNCA